MPVDRNCILCGKHFFSHLSDIKNGRGRYCSMICRNIGFKKKTELTCVRCNAIFNCRANKKFAKYCTKECFWKSLSERRKGIWPKHLQGKGTESRPAWNKGKKTNYYSEGRFKPGRFSPKGADAPNYKGGRKIRFDGYVQILNPERPGTYMLEHRYVMEQHVGHKLERNQFVHHINGVKDDNRLENLKIVTYATHHGDVICPHCCKSFAIK